MNIFYQQPEFVPVSIKKDNQFYSTEGMYIRYQHWYPEDMLKGKTVLDIGSHFGQAGAYVLSNGASEYTGLEINDSFVETSNQLLEKYYSDRTWDIQHISLEQFIKTNNKTYDIVFLGRIIHGIFNHGINTLIYLASISNSIVIESGTPLNMAILSIKDTIDNLPDNQRKDLLNYIEYEQEYIEYPKSTTGDFINTLYSIGFLKMMFNRLGFKCDISPNESMKLLYPDEYGLGYLGKRGNMMKKFVVRFDRDDSIQKNPLSRVEFESKMGVSNVGV